MYEKRKEMIQDAELSSRPLTTYTRSFKNTHKYSPNSQNACFNSKLKRQTQAKVEFFEGPEFNLFCRFLCMKTSTGSRP